MAKGTLKISSADAFTAADLAPNSVDSSELVDGSIDTSHIGDLQVTAAKVTADVATQAELDARVSAATTAAQGVGTGDTPQFAGLTSTEDISMTEGKRVTFAASKKHVNGAATGGNMYGTTNTKIPRFTATITTTGSGITYADSATLGASFTIATAGLYYVTYGAVFTGGAWHGISLNSTQLTSTINTITAADRIVVTTCSAVNVVDSVSVVQRFAVNDVLRPHTSGVNTTTATGAGGTYFIIERIGA